MRVLEPLPYIELTALLCKTDPDAVPGSHGISILLAAKGPGFTVSRDLPKLGKTPIRGRHKGRETDRGCRCRQGQRRPDFSGGA